jgi:hypothetical protein
LRGINAKAVFQQFEQQHGDLLSALQCFIDHGRASEACRLASALTAFWMATKRLDEGSTWFGRTVTTLTEVMGSAAFEQARAAGRAMTTSEGVSFVLGKTK